MLGMGVALLEPGPYQAHDWCPQSSNRQTEAAESEGRGLSETAPVTITKKLTSVKQLWLITYSTLKSSEKLAESLVVLNLIQCHCCKMLWIIKCCITANATPMWRAFSLMNLSELHASFMRCSEFIKTWIKHWHYWRVLTMYVVILK